jgi:polar amino acid transport system permease protein
MYQWDFGFLVAYLPALFHGAVSTLKITLASVILGTALSLIVAAAQASTSTPLRWLSRVYVECFVALPVIVLLVWIYYCLPVLGLTLSSLAAAIVGLSLSLSAFLAELIRGGVKSIPEGQIEAARLLTIPNREIARRIVAPQVIRVIAPALLNEYVTTLKLSTIASVITAPELLYQSSLIISQTYRPLEAYTALAGLFIVLIVPLLRIGRLLEGRRRWRI